MNQEFKTSKGWSIFIYLIAPILIILFAFVGYLPFMADEINWVIVLMTEPIFIGMIILMIYGLMSTYKGKIIIQTDRIIEIGVFKTYELEISNIKGYRTDQKYTYLVPKSADSKTIKVNYTIGNKRIFDQWVFKSFDDLNVVEADLDVQEILSNEEFGRSIEEREAKLKRAKIVARIINTAGSLLAAMLFFYPRPYELITLIALLFPLVILATLHLFKGLIRFNEKNNSGYPSIIYALLNSGIF
jgi:hypothetical protein